MSESAEKNYHQVRYGTADGEIKFGHLHQDNVQSSVMLRDGKHWNHYITLDQTGKKHRKFGTISVSPGSFQVQAGEGFGEEEVENGAPAIFLDAKKGDIVIRCPTGNLRIEAKNIHMKAEGEDNKNGSVTIEANEKITLDAQTIDATSKVSTKVFSEKNVEVIGKAILNLYGGLVDAADGATTNKGSKGGSTNEEQNKQ